MRIKKKFRNYIVLYKHAYDACKIFSKQSIFQNFKYFKFIKQAYFDYAWDPKEFFQFGYLGKNDKEKNSFVSAKEHIKLVYFFNDKTEIDFLQNKWLTYTRYKKFFKRDVILAERNNKVKVKEFLNKHDRVIIKPVDGTFGQGIKIIKSSEYIEKIDDLLRTYPSGLIIEELINQHEKMATLHPESVNTIRIYSVCYGDKVIVYKPWLRIGRGKSVIDNASAGGIGAIVNYDNGEIIATADKFGGENYQVHPDTKVPLIGFVIPYWEKLIETVKCMAMVNPSLHYAGWDMALSDKGWVLVEGNPRAQIGFQIFEQKGFRNQLDSILDYFGQKDRYYEYLPTNAEI